MHSKWRDGITNALCILSPNPFTNCKCKAPIIVHPVVGNNGVVEHSRYLHLTNSNPTTTTATKDIMHFFEPEMPQGNLLSGIFKRSLEFYDLLYLPEYAVENF